jgi:hypothetical protein
MFSGEALWIIVLVLSLAVAGAVIALSVYRLRHQTNATGEPGESRERSAEENYAVWLPVGVAIGVAIGTAMDNLGMGIAIGVAIGIALGSARGKLC